MNGQKYLVGVVRKRCDITPELRIVHIRPERLISFRAGQYLAIGLEERDRIVERPYSVASRPGAPELEFFLEVVSGGQLSPHLCAVPVGGEVFLRPAAKGRFTFDDESGRSNHFMVATGTGVAPYISMVRDRVADGQPAQSPYRIAVLHAARVSAELGYRKELTGYAERELLHYIPTVSRIREDPEWTGERGRVEDIARKHLDALHFEAGQTTVYLCGNPAMILILHGILERAGFPKESVKEERYWPAERPAPTSRPAV